jgi:hypothetical protein
MELYRGNPPHCITCLSLPSFSFLFCLCPSSCCSFFDQVFLSLLFLTLRRAVAVANVVTNSNKKGTGHGAVASLLSPFKPNCRTRFTIDGYTTRALLRTIPLAEYENHSSGKNRNIPKKVTSKKQPVSNLLPLQKQQHRDDESHSEYSDSDNDEGTRLVGRYAFMSHCQYLPH